VIASRVGGLKALVQEDHTGWFLEPGDGTAAGDLAAQLARLAAEPETRRRLGAAGKAEALANYDWARVSVRLEEIYQQAEAHAAKRYGGAR
jgi:glycosyltransferase involved in cell wall biosynthesis